MAAASCNRANLRLITLTKKEAVRLAEVEKALLGAAAAAAQPQQPAPSVLRGCIVRLKYVGAYCLIPVEGLVEAADGRPGLEVLFPDPEQRDKLSLRVPLSSASGTNPLDDASWESAGRAEVERLAALLQRRRQPLTVAEVAAAAWRKQAALTWHAAHGGQPAAALQQRVPELLQQLQDKQAIAELAQEVELDGQPQQAQQAQHGVGFTVQLPRQAGGQRKAAQPSQPPPQHAAQPPPQQERQQQQQEEVASGTALARLPASDAAAAAGGPPAAAGPGDFLAGLELQLADATARSAGDGSSATTLAVVAEIQQQLAALKHQILAAQQQQQQQQPMAPAQPAWHASSSSGGDQLSPYQGPAMHGTHVQPSPPLPLAWQVQQQAAFPHPPLLGATLPSQAWHGESASPPRHHSRLPARLPSRSPSPARRLEQPGPRGDPPLVPVAVCHFKFGGTVKWELIGRQIFVSGLPTCDGERVQRRVVAQQLANLMESTGAAVEEVKIHNGDTRGDLAYVTLATARQAARAIELLQGTELVDARRMFMRPFRTEVEALQRRFPAAAAEAARALDELAAQGPPWGPGPPPALRRRSPPPLHMRARGSSPPRGGSLPPQRMRRRSRSPPPLRGGSPPPPFVERGRKRARSGSRSVSRSRNGRLRAARSASPDAILAPVRVDHSLQRGGQQEWMLTGREVFIGGLKDGGDDAALWQQLMPLVAAAGGTVTDRRLAGSGSHGRLVYLTLATAQQAAAVIECLQGVEVASGQLFLRPVQQEVDAKCRQHPEAAASAKCALAAAVGDREARVPPRDGSPDGRRHSPPRAGSPGGSRRGREREEPPPPRRGSPGPAWHYGSRGGGDGDGGGSAFWDPAHRLEERCLLLLQREGPMPLSKLLGELGAVPPPCGPLNTGLLRRFVDSRPHLFRIVREQVEAAECAGAVLRYKRDLLQYLADQSPHARPSPEQLDAEMPLPPGLPRNLAAEGALHFVREVLWREAAVVSLPWDRSAVAVELRPFVQKDDFRAARAAGRTPPAFNKPCRFFFQLNGTLASCRDGLRCRFGHAPERADFL